MWIEREGKNTQFIQAVMSLKSQVLVVRGARQVGKTSFILNALKDLKEYRQFNINLASPRQTVIDGVDYFGRDFFGASENAEQLLYNISFSVGELDRLSQPLIIFIDEADRYPVSLEAIQTLAGLSNVLKIIYTGSNLENIAVKNVATGRKRYFDLYPIAFEDFLRAYSKDKELAYIKEIRLGEKQYSEMYHNRLIELFDLYMRLGGMPRILDAFIDAQANTQPIPQLVSDLAYTIEENVKTVLGEKSRLYEYEDILRKLALLSMDTLKISRLQVQHAGRSEVKKLVNKTVGARVAHKIRLYESGSDLSKYILFDVGILNYLLNGSDLLRQKIIEAHMAIHYETAVGNEIVATLPSRDDIFYWKSERGAQVDFMLKSLHFIAVDVKSTGGTARSLDSAAIYEKELEYIVKICKQQPSLHPDHIAKITNLGLSRKIPFIVIPHYLSGRLTKLI